MYGVCDKCGVWKEISFWTHLCAQCREESASIPPATGSRAVETGSDELTLGHLLEETLGHLPADATPFLRAAALNLPRLAPPPTTPVDIAPTPAQQPKPGRQMTKTPTIDEMGRDLTALAREGRLTPMVGRRAEMRTLARYLQRTSKRNVIVIGEAGVGKTAVVEGLAQRLASEEAPDFLRTLRIVQISVADLVAGTQYRGDFVEANPQGLILLDEMEKAHPEIQDYFLQVFDKGEATDSRGRQADFRRHLFIMTCNVVAPDDGKRKMRRPIRHGSLTLSFRNTSDESFWRGWTES